MWDQITYPFQNISNGYVITPNTLPGMGLRIHAGIMINPC